MVFLRLSVKVYPHAEAEPPGFLLLVENPERTTLRDLINRIQERWKEFDYGSEPLEIYKLVDDVYPTVDLGLGMTAADVWVDYGKARIDHSDQRGTARVIQKQNLKAPPAKLEANIAIDESAPKKELSVESQSIVTIPKALSAEPDADLDLNYISEKESSQASSSDEDESAAEDPSDTKAVEETSSVTGSSPDPQQDDPGEPDALHRKRKKSPDDEPESNKQPRIASSSPTPIARPDNNASSPPNDSPSIKRRGNMPSFVPVPRRPSLSEQPASPPKPGLGLGITASPPSMKSTTFKKLQPPTVLNGVARQLFPPRDQAPATTPLSSSPAPSDHRLRSALRKDSPATARPSTRRSVSFAEEGDVIHIDSHQKTQSTPRSVQKQQIARESASPADPGKAPSTALATAMNDEEIAQLESQIAHARRTGRRAFSVKLEALLEQRMIMRAHGDQPGHRSMRAYQTALDRLSFLESEIRPFGLRLVRADAAGKTAPRVLPLEDPFQDVKLSSGGKERRARRSSKGPGHGRDSVVA